MDAKKILSVLLALSVFATSGFSSTALAAKYKKVKQSPVKNNVQNSKDPDPLPLHKIDNINVEIFSEEKEGETKYGLKDEKTGDILLDAKYRELVKLGGNSVKFRLYNEWGLYSYEDRAEILPATCNDIELASLGGRYDMFACTYFNGRDVAIFGVIPNKSTQDIFSEFYKDEGSWIKYKNYPKTGIVVAKIGDGYGLFVPLDNATNPRKSDARFSILSEIDDVYFPDANSAIYRRFSVSFSDPDFIIVKKDGLWGVIDRTGQRIVDFLYSSIETPSAIVEEDIETTENILGFDLKKIELPDYKMLITKIGKRTVLIDGASMEVLIDKPAPKGEISTPKLSSKNFLGEIYRENNKKNLVKFENYPVDGIYKFRKGDKFGLIVTEDKKNRRIDAVYEDFAFGDCDSMLFKQLGISLSDNSKILAKKDGKWGVINKYNDVIVDFEYDSAIAPAIFVDEEINYVPDFGLKFGYSGIKFPKEDLILVQKNEEFGVIDFYGKEIIPLKPLNSVQ